MEVLNKQTTYQPYYIQHNSRSKKFNYKLATCLVLQSEREKTNKISCAPSEDLDQPGYPPSPIRVFTVRLKKVWVFSYP